MDKDIVKNLLSLARMEISEEEAESLVREFEPILGYISQIEAVELSEDLITTPARGLTTPPPQGGEILAHRNLLREDEVLNTTGEYTEILISSAPNRDGDYIKVKKVL